MYFCSFNWDFTIIYPPSKLLKKTGANLRPQGMLQEDTDAM